MIMFLSIFEKLDVSKDIDMTLKKPLSYKIIPLEKVMLGYNQVIHSHQFSEMCRVL